MPRFLADRIDPLPRAVRRRWRKLLMRSWALSRWHYSRHGMVLSGRPSDPVWYFAYGSNMHHSAFRERRGMQPTEWRVARVPGYRLRFNLHGRPKGRAAPANICPDPDCELWGVLYRITRRELLRLDSTEGVPGRHYRHVLVPAEDTDGNIVTAVTYMAGGQETDGLPSLRYISLLRQGARAHGLPEAWCITWTASRTTLNEHHRPRGSSASRKPSPTARAAAVPGQKRQAGPRRWRAFPAR